MLNKDDVGRDIAYAEHSDLMLLGDATDETLRFVDWNRIIVEGRALQGRRLYGDPERVEGRPLLITTNSGLARLPKTEMNQVR